MLLLNGNAWHNADAMIKVDAGRPSKPTARELAKFMAGEDGKVYPDPVTVDGAEGIKVETTSTDLSRPRFVIVVFRDERAYLIMAAQQRETDLAGALDQIIKSWKWK